MINEVETPLASSEQSVSATPHAGATRERILKPAVQVTLLSLVNIVIGFLVQVVLAEKFGTGVEMDAYLAATTIPTTLTAILLGALGITFVPVFARYRSMSGQSEAWQVVSSFTNLFIALLILLAGMGMLMAEDLLRITVPGLAANSTSFHLAIEMSRVLYPSIIFVGAGALFSSVAYAERSFVRPAAGPIVYNGVTILGVLVLSNSLGIRSVAWSALAGAVAQFVLLLPVAIGQNRFRFTLDLRHPGVRQALRVMTPLILGAIIFRSNTIADRFVASLLPVGSISYLGYGLKLLNILMTITSSGIVISIFPIQSEHAAADRAALGRVTSTGLRLSILLTLGVGVCFLVLRETVIRVLFERGAFDAQATHAVSEIMLFYAGALFVQSMFGSITYALYSLQQTGLTTLIAVAGALLNFALLAPLSRWLGVNGVALAYSIASTFNACILIVALIRRFRVPLEQSIITCLAKSATAALAAGGVVEVCKGLFSGVAASSGIEGGLWLVSMVAVFVILYLAVLFFLKSDDLIHVWHRFRMRLSA
ncbi:putative peptidoglycan lipid II flippase [Thermoflexales bacterium]|nr:putative peptidoglycan lipid II flippase [Thermoflexales bacterium]